MFNVKIMKEVIGPRPIEVTVEMKPIVINLDGWIVCPLVDMSS
jgi:hypothetical protein